jgi:hypothetical protein
VSLAAQVAKAVALGLAEAAGAALVAAANRSTPAKAKPLRTASEKIRDAVREARKGG